MSDQTKIDHPMVSVLLDKNFRLLWIGGSISVLGSQFSMIALPWLVLQLTSDPGILGLVLALAGLPRAFFILIGGAITDRFSPRKILLVCDWINFIIAGLVAILVFTHSMQVWMLYAFGLASGLLAGFVIPAANSIAPTVLPEKDLQAGNSLSMGTSQLMGFIGPAVAGVIVGSYAKSIEGIALAFTIDSVTFAVSALALGFMRGVDRPDKPRIGDHNGEGILASIGVAVSYLVQHQTLRLIFVVMILVNLFFTGPLLVGVPVLANQRLVEGAAAFGLLMSGYAGGNLLGYILAGGIPRPNGRALSLVIVTLIAGLGIALMAFGWILSTWLDFLLILVVGVGNGYIGLLLFTWIQQSTPKNMLGRVMSMTMLASMGLVPLSQAVSGWVSKWNLTGLFVFSGSLLLFVATWLALNPGLRLLSNDMLNTAPAE
jgi:MFS family permease